MRPHLSVLGFIMDSNRQQKASTGAAGRENSTKSVSFGDPPSSAIPKQDEDIKDKDKEAHEGRKQRVRKQLSSDERQFLLAVQHGDIKTTRRLIHEGNVDKNCVDPMGRSALVLAIINEDLPMVKMMLTFDIEPRDALLHAISEEFVEAVEVLLKYEDTTVVQGRPHSWETLPPEIRTFSSDITPLILAAHLDHFEIVRMLLDRGATLPMPHDIRCGCYDCVASRTKDTVHHSRSRINAYRALASPSLMCLTAKDPILSAFQLAWELRRLSVVENEFRIEYEELKNKCKIFATALLDHTRSSRELEIILNYDPNESSIECEGRMHLRRLKLAVKLHQKEFVTHPNVQQLLASMWYEGLPGFRRKSIFIQVFQTLRIAVFFPILSLTYIMAPTSSRGQTLKKPFVKFICHSASYLTFLALLIWASQAKEKTDGSNNKAPPSIPEVLIIAWLCGMIKLEIRRISREEDIKEYLKDMWKMMDLGTTCLYVIVIILRIIDYSEVWVVSTPSRMKSLCWNPKVDAKVLSECLLSAANIFSCLRMVYIFSISPYLGPMQVSLSRMVIDMVRFFLLFLLVLFAFSCGLNQLLWNFAEKERSACCDNYTSNQTDLPCIATSPLNESYFNTSAYKLNVTATYENGTYCMASRLNVTAEYEMKTCKMTCQMNVTSSAPNDCDIRMRFANLFETMQTLFWTVFGVIDMNQFNLTNIESFTKYWAKLILGTYTVIMNVVLLNLLIAMLNNSYQLISGKEDVEWKFARSKLWISYFDDKCTLPPPFNIFPTSKFFLRLFKMSKRCCFCKSSCCSCERGTGIRRHSEDVIKEQLTEQEAEYEKVMSHLVRRYIMTSQQRAERSTITEDDINELKQDISAFRCELIDILQQSGFTVNAYCKAGLGGRKTRQRERHMMTDFDVIPSRENLKGLWPGQPSHFQQVVMSTAGPILSYGNKIASNVEVSVLAALKKKRKKFFAASNKNRGSPSKQIVRVGSVPARTSGILNRTSSFERQTLQEESLELSNPMSQSTTTDSITTYSSSDIFDSLASQDEVQPLPLSKDNIYRR